MSADEFAPALLTTAPPARATRVRYGVLAFLCSLSFVLYLDRVCMSQAADSIMREFSLSKQQMSYVFNGFLVAYVLFEVPTGRWGDRWGSRGVLTRIVLWWSVFTALTGAAFGLISLVMVRFLFGAGEAGAYPNTARVVRRWFPTTERSRVQGLIMSSSQLGALFSPTLAAVLIRLVGWRITFGIFGAVGLVWALAFYRWFRDDPAEQPGISRSELDLIGAGNPGAAETGGEAHPPVPWRQVLTAQNVWAMGSLMTCASFGYYVYITWLPKYLMAARGATDLESGFLASLVLGSGAVGCIGGGTLTDWLVNRTGEKRRTLPAIGTTAWLCSAACMAATSQVDSIYAVTGLLALGLMCAMVQIPAWWGVCTEISGRHLGALFGLMNSMGGPGAFLSPWYVGWLVDLLEAQGASGRAAWDPAFLAIAKVQLIAALLWLLIDAGKSVVERRT